MIKNIIQGYEYEKIGAECFCQVINILFRVFKDSHEILKDELVGTQITFEEVWEHNYVSINTSFILLQQGLEAFLKWKVSEESPLLLLDQTKSDWPTLPSSKETEFSEMHHIGGSNLINTFFAVNKDTSLNTVEFYGLIEGIRKTRNEIVHVKPKGNVKAIDAIDLALEVITSFYGKDKWIELLRDQYMNNPLLGHYDYEEESAMFFERLNFIINILGKGRVNKFLTISLKSRAYCCPKCTYNLKIFSDNNIAQSKLSFLNPNDPKSDNIDCLICGKKYKVKRIVCTHGDCKGNVINADENYEETCLTCFRDYTN